MAGRLRLLDADMLEDLYRSDANNCVTRAPGVIPRRVTRVLCCLTGQHGDELTSRHDGDLTLGDDVFAIRRDILTVPCDEELLAKQRYLPGFSIRRRRNVTTDYVTAAVMERLLYHLR